MSGFTATMKAPGVKYVENKDADGEVIGSLPVCVCKLESAEGDPNVLAGYLAEMTGKRVCVTVVLEQRKLGL